MLGKLIKHDFKAVSKTLLLIHIAFCILSIFASIVIHIFGVNSYALPLVTVMLIVASFSVLFTTQIINVIRFYRNTFTDEGYLTHTLPVRPTQLLFSKGLVHFIWSIIDAICVFGMLFFVYKEFIPFNLAFDLAGAEYNITPAKILLIIILLCAASFIGMITVFYFCICVGSLFSPHKIMASIITYFVIYFVEQIISFIILFASPIFRTLIYLDSNGHTTLPPIEFFNIFKYLIGSSLIMVLLYWVASCFILSKKLNLD